MSAPERIWVVCALAEKGNMLGYRMVQATARTAEEAVGAGLARFQKEYPDHAFSSVHAMEISLPTSALAAAMQVPEVRAMQQEAYIEGIKSAADTIRSMSATAGVINERTRDLFLDVLDEVRLRALAALTREKESDA